MKQLHIALLLLLSGVAVWAGNNNTGYNIQRALEAAQQRDYETSLSFLQQELQENPTNGYAHAYIAAVCDMLPDYKSVTFHYAKTSLPLLPKNEGFMKASMEGMLSDIYYEAGDTLCALTHQKLAVSYLPTSTRFTGRLATMYEDMHNWQALYELGDNILHKVKGLEKDPLGYIVIASALNGMGRYDELLDYTQRGLQLSDLTPWQTGTLHKLHAQALISKKDYPAALNEAMLTAESAPARGAQLLILLADSMDMQRVVDSIESLILRHENEEIWPLALSDIYDHHNDYRQSIYQMMRAARIEESDRIYYTIGEHYIDYMGDAEMAEQYYRRAIALDSTSVMPWGHLSILFHDLGRYEEALRALEKALLLDPTQDQFYVAYSYMGRIYSDMHNYDRALEAYYRALVSTGDRDTHTAIAAIYRLQGRDDEARTILEQGLIEMHNDTTMDMLLAIGDTARVITRAATMVTLPRSANQHYNAACIYARIHMPDEAMRELRSAFECGFRNFYHISWDDDLDNIRNREDFRLLTEEYKTRMLQEQAELKRLIETL